MTEPAMIPVMTGMGIEVAGWPRETYAGADNASDSTSKGTSSDTTYTSDKDNSFKTLSDKSDERQEEQGPLSASGSPFGYSVFFGITSSGLDTVVERLRKLDSPLDSWTIHFEESKTHEEDDDGCDEGEDTFPNLFRFGPEIWEGSVELWEEADHVRDKTKACATTRILTTAMKAAPIQSETRKPTSVPAQICKQETTSAFIHSK
jgi:hypothetical protein